MAAWLAVPAQAGTVAAPPVQAEFCFAGGQRGTAPTLAAVAAARFVCDRERMTLAPERIVLRFELDPAKHLPHYFISRRSPLEGVHLMAIDSDGSARTRSYRFDQLETSLTGGTFKARLPEVTPQTRSIVAAVDRPTNIQTVYLARVAPSDPGLDARGRKMLLLLAALCGMLVMPLMFNAVFYRILRERFVIWHSALALTLLGTILFNSGLSSFLFDLSVPTLSFTTTIIFGLSIAASAMFMHSFIEPGMMDRHQRRLLVVAAAWALGISVVHALFPFVLRPWHSDIYYAGFLPILALEAVVFRVALGRGSRAAKFQLVGWAPLLGVAIIRMLGELTPLVAPTDAMELFYLGCAFEVLVTTMGVADRFMSIKQQRDTARTQAQVLEHLSERDALTGLLNRRALEKQFDASRAEGFTTLAVLDIDRFKQINDTFGHAVGDEVLAAAASALAPDEDTVAFRFGGEEFVLLLKTHEASERAERRRLAIPTIVAQRVPGLASPVTASMGLVEIPHDAMPGIGFDDMFRRADKLLYEAKEAGRNRTVNERVQAFRSPGISRRRKAA